MSEKAGSGCVEPVKGPIVDHREEPTGGGYVPG